MGLKCIYTITKHSTIDFIIYYFTTTRIVEDILLLRSYLTPRQFLPFDVSASGSRGDPASLSPQIYPSTEDCAILSRALCH